MGPLLAAALPGLIAGGASIIGGVLGNRASAKQAAMNREFQHYESSTAHQREVADLEAAGLNPMLSVRFGGPGASTPGGAVAPQHDVISPAVASAREAQLMKAEIELKEAQAADARASAKVKSFPGAASEAATRGVDAIKEGIPAVVDKVMELKDQVPGVVDRVMDVLKPGVDAASSARDRASVKAGDVVDAVRDLPKKSLQMFVNSGMSLGQFLRDLGKKHQGYIPPATRGKPMGKSRGKLGSANSWDYGSDNR